MNKTVNNIITFHSSNICTFTYISLCSQFHGKKILQQFVAFWTQIKLACFVPPEFEISNSNTAMKSSLAVLLTLVCFLHPFVAEV